MKLKKRTPKEADALASSINLAIKNQFKQLGIIVEHLVPDYAIVLKTLKNKDKKETKTRSC